MKHATLIEAYSPTTGRYKLDVPMKFLKPDLDGPSCDSHSGHHETIWSDMVVVHSSELAEGYPRTVIHVAHALGGETGYGYGGSGSRVLDGVDNHGTALAISGYTTDCVQQAA